MTRQKKIFHFGLWKEGVKQLRLIGFLSMIILALGAVVPLIAEALNQAKLSESERYIQTMDHNSNPLIYLVFCAVAPLMTLVLFHFLNKRNASDFYHAIPHTRLCLYVSYMAAIMTWIAALILVSGGLFMLLGACLRQYMVVLYETIWTSMLYNFVASFLVISAIGIAMSITGTVVTNIILSGLILFLPRFMIFMLYTTVMNSAPMLSSFGLPFLLSNECNLVVKFAFTVFEEDSIGKFSVGAIIYTAVLALVYFALGVFLFQRRKSETAGQSAPNRQMQALYRITVVMTYCLLVNMALVTNLESADTFTFIVLYLIAVLIYFVYELLTTKKLKQTLRTAPGLILVAVLNAAMVCGANVACKKELNFTPGAEEIQSISFTDGELPVYDDTYVNFTQYANYKMGDVEINDPEVLSVISYSLNDCVQIYKKKPSNYWTTYGLHYYYNDKTEAPYYSYHVKIKTDNTIKYRNIYVSAEKNTVIKQALSDHTNVEEIWKTLPNPIKGTLNVYGLTDDMTQQLYLSTVQELQSIPFTEWYQYCNYGTSESESDTSFSLNYTIQENGSTYYFDFVVSSKMFPKTYDLYSQLMYENNADTIQEMIQSVNNMPSGTFGSYYLELYNSARENYYYRTEFAEGDNLEALEYVCDHIIDAPYKAGNAYATISLYLEDCDNSYYTVPIDDFEGADLPALFEKY